jgi:hypothetical protein
LAIYTQGQLIERAITPTGTLWSTSIDLGVGGCSYAKSYPVEALEIRRTRSGEAVYFWCSTMPFCVRRLRGVRYPVECLRLRISFMGTNPHFGCGLVRFLDWAPRIVDLVSIPFEAVLGIRWNFVPGSVLVDCKESNGLAR